MAQTERDTGPKAPLSFAQVEGILDELLQLPEQDRAAFLATRCAGDEALRAELESLLALTIDGCLVTGGARQMMADARSDLVDAIGPGSLVGNYELLEQIGAGGMSRVYRAKRTGVDFEQTVAVKLMRSLGGDDAQRAARFSTERRVLASLSHPNISAIIDGGITSADRPYLVMEHVDGQSIAEYCRSNQLDTR